MRKNKKIDELYRDKFKEVETTPPADVWQNITDHLDAKQKKRRVLPLWFPLGGVAAAIVLALFLVDAPWNSNQGSSGTPRISNFETSGSFDVEVTSPYFEETMQHTSTLLHAIIADGRNRNSKVQRTAISIEESENRAIADNGIEEPKAEGNAIGENAAESGYAFSETPEEPVQLQTEEEEEKIPSQLLKLEEQVAETAADEELKEGSSLANRFSIRTTAAAVYFDNMGSGNTLDAQFASNDASGEVSMAYGIQVGYQLSSTLKIRTGVNKVSLNYNTRDVAFSAAATSDALNQESFTLGTGQSGKLQQNIGFIEIPMEVEYALIDKKIGLHLIGGVSTLFLNENEVALSSPFSTLQLGEAKNLNDVSFSTNIGLGLNYHLSPQFQLNLEPIFKYQINTFSDPSGINPYYFGIYSGVNFKF